MGRWSDIDSALAVSAGLRDVKNTPEEKQAAMKAVCGANATRNAEDAQLLLQALGLVDYDEEKKSA